MFLRKQKSSVQTIFCRKILHFSSTTMKRKSDNPNDEGESSLKKRRTSMRLRKFAIENYNYSSTERNSANFHYACVYFTSENLRAGTTSAQASQNNDNDCSSETSDHSSSQMDDEMNGTTNKTANNSNGRDSALGTSGSDSSICDKNNESGSSSPSPSSSQSSLSSDTSEQANLSMCCILFEVCKWLCIGILNFIFHFAKVDRKHPFSIC